MNHVLTMMSIITFLVTLCKEHPIWLIAAIGLVAVLVINDWLIKVPTDGSQKTDNNAPPNDSRYTKH